MEITGISKDNRVVKAVTFVFIRECFDRHDFIKSAERRGAAVLAERRIEDVSVQLIVADG